jgi:hypothetical protein
MATNISPISPKKYACKFCSISCAKKTEWARHIETKKHKINEIGENVDKSPPSFLCKCGKKYKDRSGLWRHEKKCSDKVEQNEPVSMAEISFLTNLVLEVVKNNTELQKQTNEIYKQNSVLQKQNQEFQKQVLDVCKNSNSTYNSHNNNKTFNMQFFLNETCKDAMNIMDFVNSMTLELTDLEDVGKLGYVEGISNIIIRKLNALDIHKRPIHCSDAKREIMYVKDENIWEKENSTYDKLRKAIKHITYKNSSLLVPWSKENPQCMNNQHHLNDVYVQMMGQAMGGKESFLESENKIMKKIAKAVLIEK